MEDFIELKKIFVKELGYFTIGFNDVTRIKENVYNSWVIIEKSVAGKDEIIINPHWIISKIIK
jgi:hypothetical protein